MIVIEDILSQIVTRFPTISYAGQERFSKFGWGDKKELNRYLILKQDESYPLVWLLGAAPELHQNNSDLIERDCAIIIATLETRQDLYNPQRYQGAFSQVLNPVADYFMQGIRASSNTRFLNDDTATLTKFPNYSEDSSKTEGGAIELWDAIRIDCRIEFNGSCANSIKWITN